MKGEKVNNYDSFVTVYTAVGYLRGWNKDQVAEGLEQLKGVLVPSDSKGWHHLFSMSFGPAGSNPASISDDVVSNLATVLANSGVNTNPKPGVFVPGDRVRVVEHFYQSEIGKLGTVVHNIPEGHHKWYVVIDGSDKILGANEGQIAMALNNRSTAPTKYSVKHISPKLEDSDSWHGYVDTVWNRFNGKVNWSDVALGFEARIRPNDWVSGKGVDNG